VISGHVIQHYVYIHSAINRNTDLKGS
jgi:hypothetical protein